MSYIWNSLKRMKAHAYAFDALHFQQREVVLLVYQFGIELNASEAILLLNQTKHELVHQHLSIRLLVLLIQMMYFEPVLTHHMF